MISHDTSDVVTTVLISNLHCSSCVHAIEETLSSLSPPPLSINVSIISQSVTTQHAPGLSEDAIRTALEDAGFDVVPLPQSPSTFRETPTLLSRSRTISTVSSFLSPKRKKHIQYCSQCREEEDLNSDQVTLIHDAGKKKSPASIVGRSSFDKISEASVVQTAESTSSPPLSNALYSPSQDKGYVLTLSIGGMTCSSCANTITDMVSRLSGVSNVVVSLLSNSATVEVESKELTGSVTETIDDCGFEAEVIKIESISPISINAGKKTKDGAFRLTLSVGGMTCSSCSNTITEMVSQLPGVTEVVVSVLNNSATVLLERKELVNAVMETIEDCGFEAEAIKVEPVSLSGEQSLLADGPRTISLNVNGMFCQHCPEKIMSAIRELDQKVTVLKPLTSYTDPILELSYRPLPPHFTIRTIISAITSVNQDSFTVSIYRPPSLEQRTREMQLREQRTLFRRLIFAVIAAIPTFIIGVVYMSLVSSSNKGKQYLMQPMWGGNASRIVWAMFFMATPVMFYSAGLYHRRSIKEIRALWRKGSTTPIIKRFTRFGSMNLLVSTGVTVAYFSSIALLALAAAQPPSPNGTGETTTYFDSVVFLAMFLLAGRFLEAYSKARTADAITALGSLRPAEALLVSPKSPSESPFPMKFSGSKRSDSDLEIGDPTSDNGSLSTQPGFKIERTSVDFLEIGDIVRVQNGATPPADGTIVSGSDSAFDESSLTGESKLIKKQIGDQVFLGTINKSHAVDVRVDAIGGVTMLDRIVTVVREGQTRRAPIERIADLITGYFVPVVTLLAIITWVIWMGLGLGGVLPRSYLDISIGGWTVWSLEFAIAVFVVACPCGIGLAAPTALLVGSGLAAKYGILARGGGEAFQEMAQLDVVVFDKTGTLTEGGEPRVSDSEIMQTSCDALQWDRRTVLGVAAELESASSHPLGIAIRHYCETEGSSAAHGSQFEEVAGRGLKARFSDMNCTAIVGNETWMHEHGVEIDPGVVQKLDAWKTEAKSVILLAAEKVASSSKAPSFTLVAIFAVTDPLRPEAQAVVRRLQDYGIGTWMISGDNETTAKATARLVGIPSENVIAGVLPHQKAEKIQWLQKNGSKRPPSNWQRLFGRKRLNERCIVAMLGDGINDAPALAAGDIGIAIGSGSDVAISSASFILISSNLRSLLTLSDLSRKVFTRVQLNFCWAVVYNLVALPIAAGVIYPAGHIRLAPVWASLAMALSSVSVVCSSLLLRLYREPKML